LPRAADSADSVTTPFQWLFRQQEHSMPFPLLQRTPLALFGMVLASGMIASATRADDRKTDSENPIIQVAGETSDDAGAKKDEIVKIKAFLAQDRLLAGGSCRVAMLVTIQEGWHINTNPAMPETMIPTQFSVKSKYGTVLKNVTYPEGERIAVKGLKDRQTIYEKQVLLYGVLMVPKEAVGKTEELELQVRYQACNADVCHPPKTRSLTGKMAVAAPGESVKSINSKYFSTTN